METIYKKREINHTKYAPYGQTKARPANPAVYTCVKENQFFKCHAGVQVRMMAGFSYAQNNIIDCIDMPMLVVNLVELDNECLFKQF